MTQQQHRRQRDQRRLNARWRPHRQRNRERHDRSGGPVPRQHAARTCVARAQDAQAAGEHDCGQPYGYPPARRAGRSVEMSSPPQAPDRARGRHPRRRFRSRVPAVWHAAPVAAVAQSRYASASVAAGPADTCVNGDASTTVRSAPRRRRSVIRRIDRSSSSGVTARISAPGGRIRRGMLSTARHA